MSKKDERPEEQDHSQRHQKERGRPAISTPIRAETEAPSSAEGHPTTAGGHRLLPPEVEAIIPRFYRTEDVEADGKTAYLRIFDPCGRFTLYVCEYEPEERTFFGYVVSPLGEDCDEWGYSSLDELESVTNRLGLPLEVDATWRPGPIPELQKGGGR